ncbi:MAG: PQQ-dependent sugar dehydrogenase [Tunicatimonas sp.]
MNLRPLFLLLGTLGCLSQTRCGDTDNEAPITDSTGQAMTYRTVEAYPNLSFTRPVDYQNAGDNSNRVFVVEQRGVISVFADDATVSEKQTFLDITDVVDDRRNEEGLLGLAFHPDYATNGYFYVNYTIDNPARSRVCRFQVSGGNPTMAEPSSETLLLEFSQPYDNHNGGQLAFGPDGYLYVAVGDGGSAGDPDENGQDRTTLLGAILRIDVDQPAAGRAYGIPADNPFAGNTEGFQEEIYAYGLRNPWRFSFDTETGQLWAADVGQNEYEEIDIIERGGNYGWDVTEATHCFEPAQGCDQSGLVGPVWEYDHSNGDVSITGGFVYRGDALPSLRGRYIYADYASGRVWALDSPTESQATNSLLLKADFRISSFGVNAQQELFLCGFDGSIYRIEAQ